MPQKLQKCWKNMTGKPWWIRNMARLRKNNLSVDVKIIKQEE